jgi:hypothetical protein
MIKYITVRLLGHRVFFKGFGENDFSWGARKVIA